MNLLDQTWSKGLFSVTYIESVYHLYKNHNRLFRPELIETVTGRIDHIWSYYIPGVGLGLRLGLGIGN